MLSSLDDDRKHVGARAWVHAQARRSHRCRVLVDRANPFLLPGRGEAAGPRGWGIGQPPPRPGARHPPGDVCNSRCQRAGCSNGRAALPLIDGDLPPCAAVAGQAKKEHVPHTCEPRLLLA